MKKLKQNEGITLIALIITIIILLMLVGVSILSIRWREWVNSKDITS